MCDLELGTRMSFLHCLCFYIFIILGAAVYMACSCLCNCIVFSFVVTTLLFFLLLLLLILFFLVISDFLLFLLLCRPDAIRRNCAHIYKPICRQPVTTHTQTHTGHLIRRHPIFSNVFTNMSKRIHDHYMYIIHVCMCVLYIYIYIYIYNQLY